MRAYIGLTGRGNAFGWGRKNAQGYYDVTAGGLLPRTVYSLGGREEITSDERGNIKMVCREMPLYIVSAGGGAVLYDAETITGEEAAALAYPAKRREEKEIPKEPPEKAAPTVYRTRLNTEPVDALPRLVWPRGCEKLRVLMESGKPVQLLSLPWRFTVIPGSGGMCFAGCAAKHGRIVKTTYAVRAKGGLMQPKALNGYKYVRSESGEGYWMYFQDVSKADV